MTVAAQPRLLQLGKAPTGPQKVLMASAELEQLYGGAKRGGKTVGGSQKAVMLSTVFPGNRGYILRQNLTDLRESTLETFFKICPPELILSHHQTHRRIELKTAGVPSVIIYSGLSDETEEESSKGKEAGWLWVDEPSEIKEKTYLMYLSQLCWTLPPCKCPHMDHRDGTCKMHPLNNGGFPPFMAMLTTNPESGWVEDRYRSLIEAAGDMKPVVREHNRVFIRSLPKDNPYLPPNWEDQLRSSAPATWVTKYLNGVWGAVEGQVYKEFDKDTHVLEELPPVEYLKTLKLIGCLDHATTGITCFCIDGVDPDGNIIALGSYYQENRLISEHARAIKMLCDTWVRRCGHPIDGYKGKVWGQHAAFDFFDYVLIDPSTQAKTQQQQHELVSNQDLYMREGIPTCAAINDLEPGISLFQEYIHPNPTHIHPWLQKYGSPRWFVYGPENREGIREMIGWKKTISDNGTVKYIGKDHWLDDQRYIVKSRPEPPKFSARDVAAMDTHGRMMQKSMAKFDAKFGKDPSGAQWFPGGGGNSVTWWPERVQ